MKNHIGPNQVKNNGCANTAYLFLWQKNALLKVPFGKACSQDAKFTCPEKDLVL
jgi:hypothetical protein